MGPIEKILTKSWWWLLVFALIVVQILSSNEVRAQQRIKEIATVAGERSNQLIGYGLVVGLDGSGDQTTQSPFTLQSTLAMLQSLGVAIPPGISAQTRNIAAVMVTAELPPNARPGQRLDLTVSSMGNARSLRGGTLLMTPLRGADGQIYALAQGNVFVGGAGAAAAGSSAVVNHLSAGRIPAGGLMLFQLLATLALGALGLLLAVPMLAVLIVLVREIYAYDLLGLRHTTIMLHAHADGNLSLRELQVVEPQPDEASDQELQNIPPVLNATESSRY